MDWSYRLFLERVLYMALIKLQADKQLTKSKAGLLCLVTGANKLGYLSDSDYEVLKAKYSIGFEELVNIPTPEQIRGQETEHNKNRQLNRLFKEVVSQWDDLKISAKEYHVNKAEENSNLKYAKEILELAQQWREQNELSNL